MCLSSQRCVTQEEFGPNSLGWSVAQLLSSALNEKQSRGGWRCFTSATVIAVFSLRLRHHFHSPCLLWVVQTPNCPTAMLLHSDIMKCCQTRNILRHFYIKRQQVFIGLKTVESYGFIPPLTLSDNSPETAAIERFVKNKDATCVSQACRYNCYLFA